MKASVSGPSVHHLLFADDSLLLCKANKEESSELKRCLQVYGKASGQVINFQKSSIIFGTKVPPDIREVVKRCLNIHTEGGEGTYLGLPECFNGSKVELLNFIKERLESRLNGWFAKSLSQGGKEVLLKSVAMSLPVYAMSCFQLPKETCKRITSAMISFWWNNEKDHRKISWVSWEKLCQRKEIGGLGFRDIGRFNQALLGKQAWRIWEKPNSLLAQILKHRYFKRKSFFEAGKGTRPSFAWRSILFGRELLSKGMFKTIGNGQNTRVWEDNWLPDKIPRPPVKPSGPYDEELLISDLLGPNSLSWNIPILRHYFEDPDVSLITQTKVSLQRQGYISWYFSKNGKYSVQSGYKLSESLIEMTNPQLQELPQIEMHLWSRIWKLKTMPKIQHFFWKVLKGALAVKERLQTRGLPNDGRCSSCNLASESICHVLFNCPMALQAWIAAKLPIPRSGFSLTSALINIHHLLSCIDNKALNPQTQKAFPWVLWNIWKARNAFVFDHTRISTESVVQKAHDEMEEWYIANWVQEIPSDRHTMGNVVRTRWKAPPSGFTKCNVGVSWINPQNHCGVGWLLRDSKSIPIFHSRRSYSPVRTRMEAELLGLLWAAENLSNLHQTKVIFEISSPSTLEALKFRNRCRDVSHLVSKIHHFLLKFSKWKVNVVDEISNSPALKIAGSVTEQGRFQSYISRGPPSWLISLINLERN